MASLSVPVIFDCSQGLCFCHVMYDHEPNIFPGLPEYRNTINYFDGGFDTR